VNHIHPKKLAEEGITPTRGYEDDAAVDLYAPEEIKLHGMIKSVVKTKVGFHVPAGVAGLIVPRSSMNSAGIHVYTGLVDPGYEGDVTVIIQNLDPTYTERTIAKGERIAQILFLPFLRASVVALKSGTRKDGGFGSTGK
jgi:dUTP pyrophosphatase